MARCIELTDIIMIFVSYPVMYKYVLSILVLKVYSCVCISVLIYFELYNKSLSIILKHDTIYPPGKN